MKIPSSGHPFRLRRAGRPVALGASALLLALALACGAAEQPGDAASPAGEAVRSSPVQTESQPQAADGGASQSLPVQTESQPQAAAGSAPVEPGSQAAPQGMAQTDQPAAPGDAGVRPSEPMAAKDTGSAPAAGSEPVAEARMDQPAETVPAAPSTGTGEPMASHREPMGEKQGEMTAPAVDTQPAPVAEAQPTEAPVVAAPLPEVGSQVGNRIPDFTLELVGGATVSAANLIEQGKPTFLFFTSTT